MLYYCVLMFTQQKANNIINIALAVFLTQWVLKKYNKFCPEADYQLITGFLLVLRCPPTI